MKYDSMNCKCGKNVILVCKTTEKMYQFRKFCVFRDLYTRRGLRLSNMMRRKKYSVSVAHITISAGTISCGHAGWEHQGLAQGAVWKACTELNPRHAEEQGDVKSKRSCDWLLLPVDEDVSYMRTYPWEHHAFWQGVRLLRMQIYRRARY